MKENKKKNYFWLIPLILGLIIGFIGVSKIRQASSVDVPSMMDSGWFEKSTEQNSLKFAGIGIAFFGFIFVGLMGSLIVYSTTNIKKRKTTFFESTITETRNFFKEVLNPEQPKAPKRFCNYCDSEIEEGSNSCEGCGSKSIRQEENK